jgi:hypothetical protein
MGLLYKISDEKFVEVRNRIFIDSGIPVLQRNGFEKSRFATAWFGKDDLNGYTYELCRLSKSHDLEIIETNIIKGDRWIQVYLNVFKPEPSLQSLEQLTGVDGMHYHLPPNSTTQMRLRIDDRKGIPLFHVFGKEHKIGSYYSESGLKRRIKELSNLIETDLNNIDHYINRWHEMHRVPMKTTWQGIPI